MLNLLICNNRLEDVENINKNISVFKSAFNESNVFIFHDSETPCDSYSKDATVLSINKNIGTLAARKYLVEHISEKYDNDYFIWLDSDDSILLQELMNVYNEAYKNNWDCYGLLGNVLVWNKIYKLSFLKEVYAVVPQDMYDIKVVYSEDLFINYIIENIAIKGHSSNIKSEDIRFIAHVPHDWVDFANQKKAQKFFEEICLEFTWALDGLSPLKEFYNNLIIEIHNIMNRHGEDYIINIINTIIPKLPEKYHSGLKGIIDKLKKLRRIASTL